MLIFCISALRAIVEMLGLCLIGQGVLYILAGRRRDDNLMYRLFKLVTAGPRRIVAMFLPGATGGAVSGVSFVILLLLWIGLAYIRKSI